MGDRTTVELWIRKKDQAQFEALIEDHPEAEDFPDYTPGVPLVFYEFQEVNDANLECEDALQAHRIPYDKRWSPGGCYPAGVEYHRITTDGTGVVQTFDQGDEGVVPLLEVEQALAAGRLDAYLTESRKKVLVMTWQEQQRILAGKEPLEAEGQRPG